MGDSSTINVMAYALFGGSPKPKVKPFTMFFCWIVKFTTQNIKTNI